MANDLTVQDHTQRAHSTVVGGSSAGRARRVETFNRKGLTYEGAKTREPTLTHARLTVVLSYDKESGLFVWKQRTSNRVRVGDIAGCVGKDGYVRLSIDGVLYLAHRVAFFYVNGAWPGVDVDHENRVASDNRWVNLRDTQRGPNSTNQRKRRAGLKGCYQDLGSGRWRAQITHRSLPKGHAYLGSFATETEAHAVYCREAARLSGLFARFE